MKRALFPLLLVLLSGPVVRAQTAPTPEFTRDDYDRCVTACWGPAPCANKASCGQAPTCNEDALHEVWWTCSLPLLERWRSGNMTFAEFLKEREVRCGSKGDAARDCANGWYYHRTCLRDNKECEQSWYEWYVETLGGGPFYSTETPGICSTSERTATCVCRTFWTTIWGRYASEDRETYKQLSCSASF